MLMKTPIVIIPFLGGNWAPAGSHLYYVKDGDNWDNVASRDGWSNPRDLVEYNFKTRDPEEVNWYLQNFVGCTVTKDGKNYSFSSGDAVRMTDGTSQRGHIFTKTNIISIPVPVLDDNDEARDAVLKTLSESSSITSRISFEMYGYRTSGSDYSRMKRYVDERRIRVRYNSGLAADGRYDWESDTLNLGFKSAGGLNERSLIIHELTHAIMDDHAAHGLLRKESEGVAFAAQCIYASARGFTLYTPIPGRPATGDDRKFEVGEKIAQHVLAGNRVVPAWLEKEMISALKGDSHYGSYSGGTHYNGITEKKGDWRDPTQPSQI